MKKAGRRVGKRVKAEKIQTIKSHKKEKIQAAESGGKVELKSS